MFDGIEFRGFRHETVEELARQAGVPVWNGLTDAYHPTQVLADLLTVQEQFGRLKGIGLRLRGRRPQQRGQLADGRRRQDRGWTSASSPPSPCSRTRTWSGLRGRRRRNGRRSDGHRRGRRTGCAGSTPIYTDVWASMGEEDKIAERIALCRGPIRSTGRCSAKPARRTRIFLHCLPAFHNLETELAKQFPDIREVERRDFRRPAIRRSSTRPKTACTPSRR